MELANHHIIKGIVLTSKSTELFRKLGKITFRVERSVNKLEIKKTIERIWDVKVDKVCVVTTKGKTRRARGNKFFRGQDQKKAIVTLKKGYKIDVPGQFETMEVSPSKVGSAENQG